VLNWTQHDRAALEEKYFTELQKALVSSRKTRQSALNTAAGHISNWAKKRVMLCRRGEKAYNNKNRLGLPKQSGGIYMLQACPPPPMQTLMQRPAG